jgi:hypothetical protein
MSPEQIQGPRVLSLWALMSLLCGVSVVCPVASLLGPAMGVVALLQIRRDPRYRGTGLAVAGIVTGLVATAGWTAAAFWWNTAARRPMIHGPVAELQAGLNGDVEAFREGFLAPGGGGGRTEAREFLNAVAGRYGRLLGSAQGPAAAEDAAADLQRPRIAYLFEFESGPGRLILRDEVLGDLVWPPPQ